MRRLLSIILLGALAVQAATIPRPAAPLQFVANTGETIDLAKLKGKVVVVEFLLTHCPACREGSIYFSKLQQELGPKGLQVIGVAVDAGAGPKLAEYCRNYATAFPVGVGPQTLPYDWLEVPPMVRMMFPQVAFVDRKGQVRAQYDPLDPFWSDKDKNVRKLLNELLAEGAAKKPASTGKPAKKS